MSAEHGSAYEVVAYAQGAITHQHRGHRAAAAVQFSLEYRAHPRPAGIGLEILQVGDQQDHFKQQFGVLFSLGGNRNHHHITAPVFPQKTPFRQLLFNAIGLRTRLVNLVDRNDDRHFGRACVVDSLDRLRHHTVISRYHQNHDVRDFGAACAHAGERFVTRCIDEDDLAPVLFDLIGADVLRNAAGLFVGDMGLPDGVEQRRLAMVHVAHDGDHGRALHLVLFLLCRFDVLHRFYFETYSRGRSAKLARDIGSELCVQGLIDRGEDVAIHKLLDDQAGFYVQLFGKFFDCDAFGDRDLAINWRRT